MDKRYQVFISSTFSDLKEERQAVLKAILEMDHMPAGMELFPAADDTAWQLIQGVIDASDYYVLIIGGRYGSLDETGISYTEKEYEHACSQGKPVIPLLHVKPDNLPRDKTDTDLASWEKLKAFRRKVEKKHTCVYWNGADDLRAKVIVGLTAATRRNPAVGWVRADQLSSAATEEMLRLRRRIDDLEGQLKGMVAAPPPGTERLASGEDFYEVEYTFQAAIDSYRSKGYATEIAVSWDQLFGAVAPLMIDEANEAKLRSRFSDWIEEQARPELQRNKALGQKRLQNFRMKDKSFHTIVVQLRALGLIAKSSKQRSVRDTATYWTLTPFGDSYMTKLTAIDATLHLTPVSHRPNRALAKAKTRVEARNTTSSSAQAND